MAREPADLLTNAIGENDLALLRRFIEAGLLDAVHAKLDEDCPDIEFPVERAMRLRREECALMLLAARRPSPSLGGRFLLRALWSLRLTRELLAAGADLARNDPLTGGGAAFYCAAEGTPEVMRLIAAHGADLGRVARDGTPAVHCAAWRADAALLRCMADLGCDLTALNAGGRSALHRLASSPYSIGADESSRPAVEPAGKLLIAAGIKIDLRDQAGATALMLAALRHHAMTIDWLLEHGADCHARDAAGAGVIHYAAREERNWPPSTAALMQILAVFVKAGVDINARTHNGATPLHDAVQGADPARVCTFLDAGANPTLRDDQGRTAQDTIDAPSGETAAVAAVLQAAAARWRMSALAAG